MSTVDSVPSVLSKETHPIPGGINYSRKCRQGTTVKSERTLRIGNSYSEVQSR